MCTHGVRLCSFLRFRTRSSSSGAGLRQRRMPARLHKVFDPVFDGRMSPLVFTFVAALGEEATRR